MRFFIFQTSCGIKIVSLFTGKEKSGAPDWTRLAQRSALRVKFYEYILPYFLKNVGDLKITCNFL